MQNPIVIKKFEGLQDYKKTWQAMRAFTDNRSVDTPDEIWLLQHHPVFTQGQAGKAEHLLDAASIPLVQSDRGGQITYHGPGQLLAYLLLDLKRRQLGVRDIVTVMEHTVIALLEESGITAYAQKSAPGVYVDIRGREHKIASLGLRVRKGCCYHGLALNVDMDLAPFRQINPCGYAGLAVTQLGDLLPSTALSKGPDWVRIENQLLALLQKRLQ